MFRFPQEHRGGTKDGLPFTRPPSHPLQGRQFFKTVAAIVCTAAWVVTPGAASSVSLVQVREGQSGGIRNTAPLEITGTVTYFDGKQDLAVVQDSSGALAIHGMAEEFSVGQRVAIHAAAYSPFFPAIEGFPFHPARTERVAALEVTDGHRFYVDRFRGRIVVPADGEYTFFLSADDQAELWLSTDGEPQHAQRIAVLTEWTEIHDYSRYPSQKSAAFHLRAGQICYLECLHAQQQGAAGLSVVWSGPSFDKRLIGSGQSPSGSSTSQTWSDLPPGVFLREVWDRAQIGDLFTLSQVAAPCDEISVHGVNVTRLEQTLPAVEGLQSAVEDRHTYSYCTAAGTAEEVSVIQDGLRFQLVGDGHRYSVRVNGSFSTQDVARLEHSRVQLAGVYKPLIALQSREAAAELLLGSSHQIQRLSLDANWNELPALNLNTPASLSSVLHEERKKIRGRITNYRADGSYEMRDEGYFAAYASADQKSWTPLGPELPMSLSDTIYGGFVLAPHTGSGRAEAVFSGAAGFNQTLEHIHVGDDVKEGTVERTNSAIKLAGYGGDTWESSDDFQFLAERIEGAREIVTRIDQFSTPHPVGKAGLMMRETLSSRSAFSEVVFTEGHASWIFRKKDAGSRGVLLGSIPVNLPYWVKLRRGFHTLIVHPRTSGSPKIGADVEVAGYPVMRGGAVEMDNAVVREVQVPSPSDSTGSVWPFVSIGQVANVPNDQRPNTCRLRGIVTYAGTYRGHYYLSVQDDTGAVFVPDNGDPDFFRPRVGQVVDLFASPVFAESRDDLNVSKVIPIEEGVLPPPVMHPAELLFSGNGTAYWTEVEGVVYNVDQNGTAYLRCNSGVMSIAINGKGAAFWKSYIDCLVRLRGVIAYPLPAMPCLLVPDPSYLKALEPLPRLSANIPVTRLRDFNRQSPLSLDKHRVRISGIVTYVESSLVIMQDENVGIAVQLAEPSTVAVGDNAVAIGFPSANGSMMLLESEVRVSAEEGQVVPKLTTLHHLKSRELDGVLVNVSGFVTRQSLSEAGQILEFQDDSDSSIAILKSRGDSVPNIPADSRLALTGVCVPLDSSILSEREIPSSATFARVILLRSKKDIVVTEHSGWWRLKRTAQIAGALLLILMALFVWIYTLRRRVQQRTQQLASAMEQLKKETEVSTLLAERNRLASEIHDSIEQGFSAILLQLDVADRLKSCSDDIRKTLNLARTMLVFSRGELRSTVWDLYSSDPEKIDLPSSLRRIVSQFESSLIELVFEVSGTVRKVSPGTEHHLVRIAQEAITNAVKHARATTISIALKYTADAIDLRVSDNGCGFSPTQALATREGHFGLKSLRTRAKKIPAEIEIESESGRGSNIKVRVLVSKL